MHYGFICSYSNDLPSPDDDIRLDHIILPTLSEEVRSRLQDVGFLGGYALLPATKELCFKTQVAIRATFLTANEWEYFMGTGEDLGEDCTAEVERRVRESCKSYLEQKLQAMEALRKMERTGMRDTLLERWEQIGVALKLLE